MFEEFDSKKVGQIMDDQRAIVESCRKRGVKPPQVCLILDDLGDQADVLNSRSGGKAGGSWLTTLACRSRHLCITWICSVQKLNQAGLTIRANTRCMCIWRLRNAKEIETLCEEMSGLDATFIFSNIHIRDCRAIQFPLRAPRRKNST